MLHEICNIYPMEDAGQHLLRDLKTFKTFNTKQYNILSTETNKLIRKIQEIESKPEEELTEELSIEYVMLSKRQARNKRILDSYVFHRRQEIINGIFNNSSTYNPYLSKEEKIFKAAFENILKEYKEDIGIPNINLNAEEPPFSLYIEIFTNTDCGILIQKGKILELKEGRIFFLKKDLIKHLLNTNKVKILN